jgi:putative sugar O-methyltransferase
MTSGATGTDRASAHLRGRIEEARAGAAWRAYEVARDQVLAWMDADPHATGAVSAYWREELAGFEYMLDASPLVIDALRLHTFHITGLRHYDYRTGKDKNRDWMTAKLNALLARGGPELLVPEHPALGGFGFEHDGLLFNLDTLKFFESAIALDDASILRALRSPDRRLAWEIGGGWGGLAYVLKTLAPGVTYVITDLPQTFLYSIPYLAAVFPDARTRCFDPADPDALMQGWEELDFVFLPHWALDAFKPPRLDLTLNTVSFQEMTTDQVRAYSEHACAQGTEWLYSLNRDRSLYNPELSSVREVLGERFALTEVEVLSVSYVRPLPKSPAAKVLKRLPLHRRARIALGAALGRGPKPSATPPLPLDDYRHVVGRRLPS